MHKEIQKPTNRSHILRRVNEFHLQNHFSSPGATYKTNTHYLYSHTPMSSSTTGMRGANNKMCTGSNFKKSAPPIKTRHIRFKKEKRKNSQLIFFIAGNQFDTFPSQNCDLVEDHYRGRPDPATTVVVVSGASSSSFGRHGPKHQNPNFSLSSFEC